MGLVLRVSVLTAGGHALDVGALARELGWEPVFYDDDLDIASSPRWRGRSPSPEPMSTVSEDRPAVIGHNNPLVRREIADRHYGARWLSLSHPSVIGEPKFWGHGCVVAPGVIFTEGVTLGDHVHINVGATISQSTTIGSHVTISPGAHICGDVYVGSRTWIGAGAIVKDHVSIGTDNIVGCGAVVVADIPDGAGTVVGVPARPMNDHSARQALAAQDRLAAR